MSDLHAAWWLTMDLIRRLLREPQVVRSLLWPVALVPLTLMFTVLGFVWLEGDWPLAVSEEVPSDLIAAFESEGFTMVTVTDPRTAVLDDGYRYGTDGTTLYASTARGRALQIERVMRERVKAPWSIGPGRPPAANERQGGRVMGVIGVLFVLFGVVFGAGMVARDRDDGTLEAQLATGTSRWIHGAARLAAGTFVLVVHYALAILVLHAILGIEDYGAVARNGFAACTGGVAIGLLVIGRSGLKNGFTGPLAGGLTAATVLAGFGLIAPGVGQYFPIASLLTDGSGWVVWATTTVFSVLVVALFTHRSARS